MALNRQREVSPLDLGPASQALLHDLREDVFRRTGEMPTDVALVAMALEALHTSRLIDTKRAGVVAALLAYAKELAVGETFTADPLADQLVRDNGFAFLLGVIFDQGIKYQRAWAAPYELRRRIGHLDPARMVRQPEQVSAAIKQSPSLHRFVNDISRYVIAAARLVIDKYGGRAEAIWEGGPTAAELQRRFDEFPGIAQKKAAMAVELLERVMKVPVSEMTGSDVAYDRHIRRVFLRTGLAMYDDPEHMIAVARELNAERPGAIDFPAWRIGLDSCHSGLPDCQHCRLRDPCPKLVDRAAGVLGP